MPQLNIYLSQAVVERLEKAAAALSLSRRDFARAILSAAAQELQRQEDADSHTNSGKNVEESDNPV